MPATSLPPGFMAHEYSRKQGRGRGTFSKILGAGPEVFQIKVTSEGFYAHKPLFFFKGCFEVKPWRQDGSCHVEFKE